MLRSGARYQKNERERYEESKEVSDRGSCRCVDCVGPLERSLRRRRLEHGIVEQWQVNDDRYWTWLETRFWARDSQQAGEIGLADWIPTRRRSRRGISLADWIDRRASMLQLISAHSPQAHLRKPIPLAPQPAEQQQAQQKEKEEKGTIN
jgi:hypothetical protein